MEKSSEPKLTVPLSTKTNRCFVCGPDNPEGFRVAFEADGERGSRAAYTVRAEHCGWPGLLHGGVAASLMDEAAAYVLYFQGLYGVTARIDTRYRHPIREGTRLVIRAWQMQQRRRVIDIHGEIRIESENGMLVAEAKATMYVREIVGADGGA